MITKNTQQLAQEVKKHIEADSVIQGDYWEDGKGCFIGCLAHGDNVQQLLKTYGLPPGLTRICEAIFEGLSLEEAKQFFADFPSAIGYDGKNISLVQWQFLEDVLKNIPFQKPEIQSVIDPVIAGIGLRAKGEKWDRKEASAAANAANAAANAAYAARYATDTNCSAYSASAAASCADSAASCADSANAEFKRQRDVLLELIRQAV